MGSKYGYYKPLRTNLQNPGGQRWVAYAKKQQAYWNDFYKQLGIEDSWGKVIDLPNGEGTIQIGSTPETEEIYIETPKYVRDHEEPFYPLKGMRLLIDQEVTAFEAAQWKLKIERTLEETAPPVELGAPRVFIAIPLFTTKSPDEPVLIVGYDLYPDFSGVANPPEEPYSRFSITPRCVLQVGGVTFTDEVPSSAGAIGARIGGEDFLWSDPLEGNKINYTMWKLNRINDFGDPTSGSTYTCTDLPVGWDEFTQAAYQAEFDRVTQGLDARLTLDPPTSNTLQDYFYDKAGMTNNYTILRGCGTTSHESRIPNAEDTIPAFKYYSENTKLGGYTHFHPQGRYGTLWTEPRWLGVNEKRHYYIYVDIPDFLHHIRDMMESLEYMNRIEPCSPTHKPVSYSYLPLGRYVLPEQIDGADVEVENEEAYYMSLSMYDKVHRGYFFDGLPTTPADPPTDRFYLFSRRKSMNEQWHDKDGNFHQSEFWIDTYGVPLEIDGILPDNYNDLVVVTSEDTRAKHDFFPSWHDYRLKEILGEDYDGPYYISSAGGYGFMVGYPIIENENEDEQPAKRRYRNELYVVEEIQENIDKIEIPTIDIEIPDYD